MAKKVTAIYQAGGFLEMLNPALEQSGFLKDQNLFQDGFSMENAQAIGDKFGTSGFFDDQQGFMQGIGDKLQQKAIDLTPGTNGNDLTVDGLDQLTLDGDNSKRDGRIKKKIARRLRKGKGVQKRFKGTLADAQKNRTDEVTESIGGQSNKLNSMLGAFGDFGDLFGGMFQAGGLAGIPQEVEEEEAGRVPTEAIENAVDVMDPVIIDIMQSLGYVVDENDNPIDDADEATVTAELVELQGDAGLEETGVLDEETKAYFIDKVGLGEGEVDDFGEDENPTAVASAQFGGSIGALSSLGSKGSSKSGLLGSVGALGSNLGNSSNPQGNGIIGNITQSLGSQRGGVTSRGALGAQSLGNPSSPGGGGIANAVSQLGFSDGSPFAGANALPIQGNQITMQNTSQPLLGIGDNGQTQLMGANSGQYNFPGASNVLEVPLNNVRQMFGGVRRAQMGGYVHSLQAGGNDPAAQGPEQQIPDMGIPVQTELGEVFVTPFLDIIDVVAKEKHTQMKDDVVTDIMKAEYYVFSDDKKMMLSFKEAEKISFGYGSMVYQEGAPAQDLPQEILLSDYFGKDKKMTFAQLAKRVRSDYKVKKSDDLFDKRSYFRNKEAREGLIMSLIYLNERKKNKKDNPEQLQEGGQPQSALQGFEPQLVNPFNSSTTEIIVNDPNFDVGSDNPNKPLVTNPLIVQMDSQGNTQFSYGGQKKQLGGIIGAGLGVLGGIGSGIAGIVNSNKARRAAEQQASDLRESLRQGSVDQQQNNVLQTALGLSGLMAQNTTQQARQFDTTLADNMQQRSQVSERNNLATNLSAANQPFVNAAMANSGNAADALNNLAPLQGRTSRALSQASQAAAKETSLLRNNFLTEQNRIRNLQFGEEARVNEANRINTNARLNSATGLGTRSIANTGRISEGLRANTQKVNQQEAQAIEAARQAKNAAIQGMIGSVTSGASGLLGQIPGLNKTPSSAATSGIGLSAQSPVAQGILQTPPVSFLPEQLDPNAFSQGFGANLQTGLGIVPGQMGVNGANLLPIQQQQFTPPSYNFQPPQLGPPPTIIGGLPYSLFPTD